MMTDHSWFGHSEQLRTGVRECSRRPPPFADALAAKNVARIRIPARSPNHNAVVERFRGTCVAMRTAASLWRR